MNPPFVSRRDFVKTASAGIVGGIVAGPQAALAQHAPHGAGARDGAIPPRTLIRGATIMSMDPAIGNFEKADLLIDGSRIAGISPAIPVGGAAVVDGTGTILIPGFCDPHIHAWHGQLSGIIPNRWDVEGDQLSNYANVIHKRFAPVYRPEDMYIGTLTSLLNALNAGITTVNDCSHNSRSAAHSDAAIRAFFDSGVRGNHAAGPPSAGEWDRQWPDDLYRIRKQFFSSDDQLVNLRIFPRPQTGIPADSGNVLKVRRDLDLWFTFDTAVGLPFRSQVPALYESGVLTGKETFNHAMYFDVASREAIAAHGAQVSVAPRSDAQALTNGWHHGFPAIQDWLDVGILPGIGSAISVHYAIDMFTEMKLYYAFQHAVAQSRRFDSKGVTPRNITLRETLEAATIRGAENCGLAHKVGSLTPGKEADILMIKAEGAHLLATYNAFVKVVEGATIGDVDTIFLAGKMVKRNGVLLGVDWQRLETQILESRNHLFRTVGWKQDRFAD